MSEGGGEGLLRLTGVTRRFGSVVAVDDFSLAVQEGEVLTLLGPSGCGKTTALRLVAGFELPDAGAIAFGEREVTRWTPQRRGFGMVFQNYALFPHLNVFENVAFGLRARRLPAESIRARVDEALRIVDLEGYGERAVQALSGGQQQRVALARALAIEPPLLLLDEPLSNLDQALRVRTRTELRALVRKLGITAIFVTHDQEEAFDLSDRIAVMRAGRIRQIGTPRELYDAPEDRFVAGFVGRANTLPVELAEGVIRLPGGVVWSRGGASDAASERGGAILLFRPEDVALGEGSEALRGVVQAERFRGAVTLYEVEVDGGMIEVAAPPGRARAGERVGVVPVPGARLHLFPVEGKGPSQG